MGPVGPGTDGDRPQGKSQLEVVPTGIAVIVGVDPTGANHIDPDHSHQVSSSSEILVSSSEVSSLMHPASATVTISVVSKIALEHLMYFASGYSA